MEKILNAWNDIDKHDVEQPRAFDAESGSYTYDDGFNYIRLKEAQDEIINGDIGLFHEWLLDNDLLIEALEVVRTQLKEKNQCCR